MTLTAVPTLPHLLRLADLDEPRLAGLLELAAAMKHEPHARRSVLARRSVACCFARPYLPARVAFAAAINHLGGLPVLVDPGALEVDDAARVLSSCCDAIVMATPGQADVAALAAHSAVPVINAGTAAHDPFVALAACLTVREHFGRLADLDLAYVGAGDGVCHALVEAGRLAGLRLHLACPPGHAPDPAVIAPAAGTTRLYDDPREAVSGAQVVYAGAHGRVTRDLMALTAHEALLLHDLHDGVIENRPPTAQALLYALVTDDWET